MNKYIYFLITSVLIILGLFFYQNSLINDGKLHMIVCNVGQGDAILIRTPNGSDILVDGGPDSSVLNCLSLHMPFWDRTIEAVILTHPDADHLTGVVSVIERYSVINLFTQSNPGHTLIYKRFQKAILDKNITPTFVSYGDKIEFKDKTTLDIVWPESTTPVPTNNPSSLPLNEFSVISVLSYGEFRALLTGDAGVKVEDTIAKRVGRIDILKVPHHGSKTGMSDYFLSEINPSLAIISVGAKNRYGHPTKEALNLLTNRNIKYLRTDINGEVEVITNGKDYSLYSN